jgi:rSAM/selenodomain-associated transferase 2
MRLAIIVPVLNEAAVIGPALARLAPLRARGAKVIVVDGGSHDGSVQAANGQVADVQIADAQLADAQLAHGQDATGRAAEALADRIIVSARGRALQMNAGARDAAASDADVLLFLHADTELPPEADRLIFRALSNDRRVWGRFDAHISGRSPWLPLVTFMMNWRSRLTGICTGDQAIFVTRGAFVALEGFAPIALMEDIEFSRRARRLSAPLALRAQVKTSGRRWDTHGAWRTIVLMWRLRLAYFLGADPEELARRYRASGTSGNAR